MTRTLQPNSENKKVNIDTVLIVVGIIAFISLVILGNLHYKKPTTVSMLIFFVCGLGICLRAKISVVEVNTRLACFALKYLLVGIFAIGCLILIEAVIKF